MKPSDDPLLAYLNAINHEQHVLTWLPTGFDGDGLIKGPVKTWTPALVAGYSVAARNRTNKLYAEAVRHLTNRGVFAVFASAMSDSWKAYIAFHQRAAKVLVGKADPKTGCVHGRYETLRESVVQLRAVRDSLLLLAPAISDGARGQKNGQQQKNLPRNWKVTELARRIHKDRSGAKKRQIALEFTEGDEKQADSLLRQLRRPEFKHLMKS